MWPEFKPTISDKLYQLTCCHSSNCCYEKGNNSRQNVNSLTKKDFYFIILYNLSVYSETNQTYFVWKNFAAADFLDSEWHVAVAVSM